ncbi:outer membrane protein assembly factor BamB [Pseudaeromonas paramecii]|uniref:Outer membrane protein assembly factor BamB n=1 Tax=Pseudaeromonas paramecii TaxID=2138166 RepID=A0ABP8Q578_9GAMM
MPSRKPKSLSRWSLPLLVTLTLSGCSLFGGEEDVVVMDPVPQAQTQFAAKTLWKRSVGDGVGNYYSQLAPVIADERLFAAARDGQVVALDKQDGQVLWKQDLSDLPVNDNRRSPRLSGGLTASYEHLFVGSENGVLYCLSQETGELVWQTEVAGEILAAPAVDDGKVVVNTSAGRLFALDAEDGHLLWTASDDLPKLTLRGVSRPVITSGGVLYGRADGRLNVLLLENGQLAHLAKVANPSGSTELDRMVDVDAAPLVLGNELFAIAYNGELVAQKLISGDELWKRRYASYQDLAFGLIDLVLTDSKGHVYSVDRSNGRERWANNQLSYRNVTAPVVFGDYVLVGDGEGYLYWLSDTDGQIVAMQQYDSDGLYVPPLVDGDTLYLQTRSGDLVALQRP